MTIVDRGASVGTGAPPTRGRTRITWSSLSESLPMAALGVLVALTAVMLVVNADFVSTGNLRSLAQQSAVPAVIAVGLTFVILMGGIDLSVEGNMAMASLVTALLVANDRNAASFGAWGLLAAAAAGAGLGLVAGAAVSYLKAPSFIVTIGTWQIGLGVSQLLFGSRPPRIEDEGFRSIANRDLLGLPSSCWVALAVVVAGLLVQRYTRFGRYAYVIGGSTDIALLSGINVMRYRLLSFVLSGACVGLAAALATARTGVGDSSVGSGFLFTTVAGVVIGGTLLTGGRGGVLHSVVGVTLMVAIANAMVLAGVSSLIQATVQGLVVVVAVSAIMWRSREHLRVVK